MRTRRVPRPRPAEPSNAASPHGPSHRAMRCAARLLRARVRTLGRPRPAGRAERTEQVLPDLTGYEAQHEHRRGREEGVGRDGERGRRSGRPVCGRACVRIAAYTSAVVLVRWGRVNSHRGGRCLVRRAPRGRRHREAREQCGQNGDATHESRFGSRFGRPSAHFPPAPPSLSRVTCGAAATENSSWVSAACDGPARDVRRGRRERTGTRAMRSASGRQAPRDSRPRGAPWSRLASPSPHPPCAAADLPAAPPPLPMRPTRSVRAVRRGIRQPGPLRDDSRAPTTAGSQPTRPCLRHG